MWRQTWHDLLFAHWPVAASVIRPLVPGWLNIDEYGGTSWVGVVPFRMTGVTLHGVPSLPVLSHFPEMNLRVYVERDGKAGVWFISLDATRLAAVWAARRFAHLPYYLARMNVTADGDSVVYSSERRDDSGVAFAGTYRPIGPVHRSAPGSLEHFLTERYCLYTQDSRGRRLRLEIHHPQWPLQPADARIALNRVAQPQGIELPDAAPILHFSRRIDVIGWGVNVL
jgi:uncharacterized protein YqjF (DUF2071 family)